MFVQFHVSPFTIWRALILILRSQLSAYAIIMVPIELYNRDLQTAIILFICNLSSHKTDWILSDFIIAYYVISFISHGKESTKCTWRRMSLPLWNLYKCKQVAFLLLYPIFYTDVVAIFLFISWLCKQAHYFCFWRFCLSLPLPLKAYIHT